MAACERAAQLTRQLLSLGRRKGGHQAVVDVETEMDDLVPLLRGAAGSSIDLAFEIAKPLGTVKSWVRRGLQSLRSCLDRAAGLIASMEKAA